MPLTANVIRGLPGGIAATNISSGILSIARGGTGTDTSTGSGSVVLNSGPILSNTVVFTQGGTESAQVTTQGLIVKGGSNVAPSITFSGNVGTGLSLPVANTLAFSTGGIERMRVDATGNVIAKGIIRNIYHQANTTNFSVGTTFIDGPVWEAVDISANSKVKVYVYVPWRNNSDDWGGMYIDVQFRVNQNVGTYVANSWVSLGVNGYHMMSSSVQEILQYTNELYLPFTIPTAFTLQFKYRYATYNGTATSPANNNIVAGDTLLAQFGISANQFYPKIIITEIGS